MTTERHDQGIFGLYFGNLKLEITIAFCLGTTAALY